MNLFKQYWYYRTKLRNHLVKKMRRHRRSTEASRLSELLWLIDVVPLILLAVLTYQLLKWLNNFSQVLFS